MDSSSQEIVNSHDFFDRLPDEIVRSIFNQLRDARSLCSSMSVCKRFRSIAPQVDHIFLPIPRKKSVVRESDLENRRNSLKDLVIRALAKPFHIISQAIKSKSKSDDKDLDFYSHSIPNEILKSFQEIRALHIRLPCHENQKQTSKRTKKATTFLKWKAEFGTELQSCVILGSKSWKEKDGDLGEESRVMGEDELKLRIVWTISCLIAAAARHYLIEETVKGLKTVENVVVSDESEQGRVCMKREQVVEMRASKGKEGEHHRSRVPALGMKMWYLEKMEMSSGKVMEGATLVVIRPAAAEVGRSDGDMVADAFGVGNEVGEAARKLMVAKKCYVLEMNSF